MNWAWQAIATFVAMAALDYVWAYYQRAVTQKAPVRAAQLSAMLIVLNAGVVLSYADDHWMILPAAAGAFIGTYYSVRRH
jgi:hypothetical protein